MHLCIIFYYTDMHISQSITLSLHRCHDWPANLVAPPGVPECLHHCSLPLCVVPGQRRAQGHAPKLTQQLPGGGEEEDGGWE